MPVDINLSAFIGGCNGRDPICYTFYSCIKCTGWRTISGHYTAYVREGEDQIKEVNDERITTRTVKHTLEDINLQKGVKLVVYVRKDCLKPKEVDTKAPKIMPESCINLENILKGEPRTAATGLVNCKDLRMAMNGDLLSSGIIDAFFSKISSDMNGQVLCVNSFFFPSLLTGQTEKDTVVSILRGDDLAKLEIKIIPIHLKGCGADHFGGVATYPRVSLMVYADSGSEHSKETTRNVFLICLSLIRLFHKTMKLTDFLAKWTLVATDEV